MSSVSQAGLEGTNLEKDLVRINDVRDARARISPYLQPTPVLTSSYIDSVSDGLQIYFKCENLQKTGSFKV